MGEKLGKFEVEKRQAVENEDYDKAKLKKVQMDEYRLQIYRDLNVKDLLEQTGVIFDSLDASDFSCEKCTAIPYAKKYQ